MNALTRTDLAPATRLLTVEKLTPRSCRWPIGNPGTPDFGFCGVPQANMLAVPSQPYCEHHRARAYVAKKAKD